MCSIDGELSTVRSSFSLKFKSALWIMTTGLQFVIGWWYRKAAVFYLPPGWFGPLTWWLAFPFAPAGSVSCGMWQMACKRVIKVGERVVKEVIVPSPSQGEYRIRRLNSETRLAYDERAIWISEVRPDAAGSASARSALVPVSSVCRAPRNVPGAMRGRRAGSRLATFARRADGRAIPTGLLWKELRLIAIRLRGGVR